MQHTSAFYATFLDPYLDDDRVLETDLTESSLSLASLIESVVASSAPLRENKEALENVIAQLRQCAALSKKLTSPVLSSSSFREIVLDLSKRIQDMHPSEYMFIPGGWQDGISQDVLAVYVVVRTSTSKFTFVACDTSRWSRPYQERSYSFLPKVRRCLCSYSHFFFNFLSLSLSLRLLYTDIHTHIHTYAPHSYDT